MPEIPLDATESSEGPSVEDILAELTPEKRAILERRIVREIDPLNLEVEDGSERPVAQREAEAAGALTQLQRLRGRLRDRKVLEDQGLTQDGPTSESLAFEMVAVRRRYEAARKNLRRARDRAVREAILAEGERTFVQATLPEADPRTSLLARITWIQLQIANGRGGLGPALYDTKARYARLYGEPPA